MRAAASGRAIPEAGVSRSAPRASTLAAWLYVSAHGTAPASVWRLSPSGARPRGSPPRRDRGVAPRGRLRPLVLAADRPGDCARDGRDRRVRLLAVAAAPDRARGARRRHEQAAARPRRRARASRSAPPLTATSHEADAGASACALRDRRRADDRLSRPPRLLGQRRADARRATTRLRRRRRRAAPRACAHARQAAPPQPAAELAGGARREPAAAAGDADPRRRPAPDELDAGVRDVADRAARRRRHRDAAAGGLRDRRESAHAGRRSDGPAGIGPDPHRRAAAGPSSKARRSKAPAAGTSRSRFAQRISDEIFDLLCKTYALTRRERQLVAFVLDAGYARGHHVDGTDHRLHRSGRRRRLTEAVRRRPYQVVLFDEIEKAHPEVFNALLQLLDRGRLADGHGRTVDFSNTIIIMTSNVGGAGSCPSSRAWLQHDLDRGRQQAPGSGAEDHKAMKETFRPEFVNRIEEMVVFQHLSMEELTKNK